MTPQNNLAVQIAMRIKEVETTNQYFMYDTVCLSLAQEFIAGDHHMTFVTYGPYGNGKTYTLIGDERNIDHEPSKGILPRFIYDTMSRLLILEVKTGIQYLYYVSFIEIYNDIVIDLLSVGEETRGSFVLDIDELGYTHIHGVSKMQCTSYTDVLHYLKLGLARRNSKTLDTHLSSLSHAVFTFHIYKLSNGQLTKHNKLIFIDLTSNESENLIEESIHSYNEYYNSSYQIIYDVIANKYPFIVPNYFTAIHKFLQDAFNANLVKPVRVRVTCNEFDIVLPPDQTGLNWYKPGAPQAPLAAPNPPPANTTLVPSTTTQIQSSLVPSEATSQSANETTLSISSSTNAPDSTSPEAPKDGATSSEAPKDDSTSSSDGPKDAPTSSEAPKDTSSTEALKDAPSSEAPKDGVTPSEAPKDGTAAPGSPSYLASINSLLG